MPAGYHINPDEGLITIRVEGDVDFVDLLETARVMLADISFDGQLPYLVDLRGMSLNYSESADGPFNRFIIQQFGGHGASIAIVVDDELQNEHCAAIFKLACALGRAELFENYEQAVRWLMRREFAVQGSVGGDIELLQQPDAAENGAHGAPE